MKKIIFLSFIFVFVFNSCSVIKTMVNLSRLKFRLGSSYGVQVAGVNLDYKNKFSDFSPADVLRFSSSFLNGSLPITFTLNVEAKNPNDGTGGYARTNASITSFPFRFVLNDKGMFVGNISSPVYVPGTGEVSNIPVAISFDLFQMFKDKGYQDLVNLGLQIAGIGKGTSNISLYAKPTVSTDYGSISYPGELKIVDTQFSN